MKDIESVNYTRKAEELTEITSLPPMESSKGRIINLETLFPVWDDESHDTQKFGGWSGDDSFPKDIKYPHFIKPFDFKALGSLLAPDCNENGDSSLKGMNLMYTIAKCKLCISELMTMSLIGLSDKTGKAQTSPIPMTEAIMDESGNLLPRMFVDSDEALLRQSDEEFLKDRRFHWGFSRGYSGMKRFEKHYQHGSIVANLRTAEDSGIDEISSDKRMSFTREVQEASAPVIDPFICQAFEITRSFYVCNEKENINLFLWNSIWPKLPSGRPCYNPAGKYYVRLYLCGKWRKVTVSDIVPVDESGRILIASSAHPVEMWPTIIAKAIYTLYDVCGYSSIPPCDTDSLNETAARFIGFALQCLNGWVPSLPYSLSSAYYSTDKTRMKYILDQFRGSTTPLVSAALIPEFDSSENTNLDAELDITALKTIKGMIFECKNKEIEENKVLNSMSEWKAKVKEMSLLLRTPRSDFFFLVGPSKSNDKLVSVLPVLIVTTMSDEIDHDTINPLKMRVLVHWSCSQPSSVHEDASQSDFTNISQEWISMQELVQSGYILVRCKATSTESCVENINLRWQPMLPAESREDSKSKKKTNDNTKDVLRNQQDVDPGFLCSTLVRVQRDTIATPHAMVVSQEERLAKSITGLDVNEITPSIALKDAFHGSITITVQVDMQIADEPQTVEETNHRCMKTICPDDVVVMLQELDGCDSKILRMEISKSIFIPLACRTFAINVTDTIDGKLFILRVFSKSSLGITLSSNLKMSVGSVDDLFPRDDTEKASSSVYSRSIMMEGEMGNVTENFERTLCCLPLKFQLSEESSTDDPPDFMEGGVVQTTSSAKKLSRSKISPVTIYFHTSDRVARRYMSFALVDPISGSTQYLGKTDTNVVYVPRNESGYFLILSVFCCKRNLRAFDWKLVVTSMIPLHRFPSQHAIPVTPKRFSGFYMPNNAFRVFRDKLTVCKDQFPISLKVSVDSLNSNCSFNIETPIVLRVYREVDKHLIREIYGRNVLALYALTYQHVTAGTKHFTTVSADRANEELKIQGKKGIEEDANVKAFEIILDCAVDQNAIASTECWQSPYPFIFCSSANLPYNKGIPNEKEVIAPACTKLAPLHKFKWNLDVIYSEVNEVCHDLKSLEIQTARKNGWNQAKEGRTESAKMAYRYYYDRKFCYTEEETSETQLHQNKGLCLSEAMGNETALIEKEYLLEYQEFISNESFMEIVTENLTGDANYMGMRSSQREHFREATSESVQYCGQRNAVITSKVVDMKKRLGIEWKCRKEFDTMIRCKNGAFLHLKDRVSRAGFDC